MMLHLVAVMLVTLPTISSTASDTSSFATENNKVYGSKIVLSEKGHTKSNVFPVTELYNFAFSTWIKVTRNTSAESNVYLFSVGAPNSNIFLIGDKLMGSTCGSQFTISQSYKYNFGKWVHFVYSSTSSRLSIWMNGKHWTSYYKYAGSCNLYGATSLGHSIPQGYQVEFAYANAYPFSVSGASEVATLKSTVYSDSRAFVPWNSFLNGHHTGAVTLEKETEVLMSSGSKVHCSENYMNITLSRRTFRYLNPTLMSLQVTSCNATSYNEESITFIVPLDKCGTSRRIHTNSTLVTFTNWVYPDYNQQDTRNAKPIAFACNYYYTFNKQHAFISAYWVVGGKDVIRQENTGWRDIPVEINLYHDDDFTSPFREEEYPLETTTKSNLIYASVGIPKTYEVKKCIEIRSCFLNLSRNPKFRPKYDLFVDGIAMKNVKLYKDPVDYQRRFSFLATEVDGHNEESIYLHCCMDFCNIEDALNP